MALEKLQANIESNLLRDVEEYARSLHITKTAAVSVLLSRALQSEKLANSINDLMEEEKKKKLQG